MALQEKRKACDTLSLYMKLHTSVAALKGVGTRVQSKLINLGIRTVEDLLMYFPFRYEDFSKMIPIRELQDGDEVTIRATIELISSKRSARKRMMLTEAILTDGTDKLRAVWFRQPYISKSLKIGDVVLLSGKINHDMFGVSMKSPTYEKVVIGAEHTQVGRILPMYSLTAGINQKLLRSLIEQVIDLADEVAEWMPEDILEKADLTPLRDAIRQIHFPNEEQAHIDAAHRLKFDELFILQLRGEMIRQSIKRSVAPAIPFHESEIKEFVKDLPFILTKDQKVAAWQILQDMETTEPMNRLLEGDVGSGKTVVAALVAHNVLLAGKQVVVMAPTEILAKQHYVSFQTFLGTQHTVGLLTQGSYEAGGIEIEGSSKVKRRAAFVEMLRQGEVGIVVGTHALLTDDVLFKDLGLVVVDEQHRFGVAQRKTIREKSGVVDTTPHFLSMTATPIPRSFALTLYGDLDLSIIKEMPAGRKTVQTRLVDAQQRQKAYDFIRSQVAKDEQVFVICPMIDEVDGSEKKSVMQEFEKLNTKIYPGMRIGFLHGKLKSAEKDETMRRFAAGEIDVLVSTSVVEVGVDIPNATVMMIEDADRFGLAQLHQFRGRVGRSEKQSYCFLFTDSASPQVQERLAYFEKTNDGFAVAEYDLEMRGPGQVYGISQSGMGSLRLASMQDKDIIKKARECARGIDFELYPQLREKVEEWEQIVHLE